MNISIPYLVDIMTQRQKVFFNVLFALWLIFAAVFWIWWLDESHVVGRLGFVLNSTLIAWNMMMPAYFFFFVAKMKKPNPKLPIPKGLLVAMVVTKAPSEPFEVVKKTLSAMLSQKYAHDTWLADEDPTEEVYQWCKRNGVFVSTRKGAVEYHRPKWPRKTKCKEGNLAYFYDNYGYYRYEFVIQMDADHVPEAGYLEEMLRPFADPAVGYVSAPSICDANAKKSWAARARLYAEATLHGPLQSGYNAGWAPLCIGSHYAVRTKALKEIGGLGPELAEDHTTTLMMNANKWRGIHATDAIAHGDGAESFTDSMFQEFQWTRSLIIILLTVTPKYLKNLPSRFKLQFLFSELWYPLFSTTIVFAYSLPIIALVTNKPWVNVTYIAFSFYTWILTIITLSIIIWIKNRGWLRPSNSKFISWETFVFQLIRWPWVLLGVLSGIIVCISRKDVSFKVTSKGEIGNRPLKIGMLTPYLVIIFLSYISLYAKGSPMVSGYLYFVILNIITYTISIFIIIKNHFNENKSFSRKSRL